MPEQENVYSPCLCELSVPAIHPEATGSVCIAKCMYVKPGGGLGTRLSILLCFVDLCRNQKHVGVDKHKQLLDAVKDFFRIALLK